MPRDEPRYFLNDSMYAAMSSAAARLNGSSGIFGCGSSKKYVSERALKFGDRAIVAKGGTSALARCWSAETTWHDAHHLFARSRPCSASAECAAGAARMSVAAVSGASPKTRMSGRPSRCPNLPIKGSCISAISLPRTCIRVYASMLGPSYRLQSGPTCLISASRGANNLVFAALGLFVAVDDGTDAVPKGRELAIPRQKKSSSRRASRGHHNLVESTEQRLFAPMKLCGR
jgi:hypothetical protein